MARLPSAASPTRSISASLSSTSRSRPRTVGESSTKSTRFLAIMLLSRGCDQAPDARQQICLVKLALDDIARSAHGRAALPVFGSGERGDEDRRHLSELG